MARTKVTVRASCCNKPCWIDSDHIVRCADSSLPMEDCVATRAMEEEAERERQIARTEYEQQRKKQEKKRKRMAFEEVIDALGESNKAKMSGRAYPKTCAICSYHEPNITKEGEKYYKVVHYVDKVPFDCCSFCLSEIEEVEGYKVLRCLNELIPFN